MISNISVSAIIQIAIIYIVIYSLLKRAKGSRVGQSLFGILLLVALSILCTYLFHFEVLATIIQFLVIYIAGSTVVIFQPEIRRMLSSMGAFGSKDRPKFRHDGAATPEMVVQTVMEMSRIRMGALLAFERGISLRSYEDSGVVIDAVFSTELMKSIFTPPLPLHDGGAVIRNGRLASAHCLFPVSNNQELITFGMRHRAAVGLSEDTDALVVAISEESGSVSIAHNGKIYRYEGDVAQMQLRRWLNKILATDVEESGLKAAVTNFLHRMISKSPKGGNA